MAEDGGTGAPATGDGGQPPASQPPAPPAGQGGPPPPADGGRNGTGGDGFDRGAWEAIASEYGGPDKVRERLGHARTWEQRAKQNRDAAEQASGLQQQLDDFAAQMAQRDERDVERAGRAATALLKASISQHGIEPDDVAELLPEPIRLLKNGDPDDEAIANYAGALAKVAGRPAPDHDQGRRSDQQPTDMNALIRRAAGRL